MIKTRIDNINQHQALATNKDEVELIYVKDAQEEEVQKTTKGTSRGTNSIKESVLEVMQSHMR